MRVRLREAYTPDELAAVYPRPHSHERWPDHRLRVALTVPVARFMYRGGSVADLSCGDAAIAKQTAPAENLILGDLAPGYGLQGPIEDTLDLIPSVDLFLCCETLEHLDDPDVMLTRIRRKARALVLSTPDGETDGGNPEHYWGWGVEDVRGMLTAAGFMPVVCQRFEVAPLSVAFQIWGCE